METKICPICNKGEGKVIEGYSTFVKRYKWIEIVETGKSKTGKTFIFDIVNKNNLDVSLGQIKWNTGYRKYAFYPIEGSYYEEDCLINIADFLIDLKLNGGYGIAPESNNPHSLTNSSHDTIRTPPKSGSVEMDSTADANIKDVCLDCNHHKDYHHDNYCEVGNKYYLDREPCKCKEFRNEEKEVKSNDYCDIESNRRSMNKNVY